MDFICYFFNIVLLFITNCANKCVFIVILLIFCESMEPRIVFLQPKVGAIAEITAEAPKVTNKSRPTEQVSKSAPLGNDHASVPVAPLRAAESAAIHSAKPIGVDGIMEPLLPQQPPPPLPPTSTYPVGSPPPSSSRLPPDGHEFPVNYIEPISLNIDSTNYNNNNTKLDNTMFESKMFIQTESLKSPPPLPKSVPPPVLPRLSTFNDINIIEQKESTHVRRLSTSSVKETTRPSWVKDDVDEKRTTRKISTSSIDDKFNKSSWSKLSEEDKPRSWRKDVKSECSVRDKIAMFSNSPSTEIEAPLFPAPAIPSSSTKRLSKTFKSSEDVFNSHEDSEPPNNSSRRYSKSSLSIDKLGLSTDQSNTNGTQDKSSGSKTEIKIETKTVTDVDTSNRRFSSTLELRPRITSTTDAPKIESSVLLGTGSSSTLPRKTNILPDKTYQSPQVLTRAMSFSGSPYVGVHNRSQSLSDAGTNKLQSEAERKNNLNNLIEQRRKSMSKLRGLVIPERVVEVPSLPSITDLPEIRSRDSILNNKPPIKMKTPNSLSNISNVKPSQLVSPPPWKLQENTNSNLPKYSPAFKRKSLQVYADTTTTSSPLSSSREDLSSDQSNGYSEHSSNGNGYDKDYRRTPVKPPRTSLNTNGFRSKQLNSDSPKSFESLISPRSDISFDFVDNKFDRKPIPKMRMDLNTRVEEDSDNDSAVSSSQSSYVSRGYSPPSSPVQNIRSHAIISPCPSVTSSDERQNNDVNIDRQPLRRTLSSETNTSVASSTTSTLTSGSQASCSSIGSSNYDSRRVLKPQSVEAINRKNILASAKCRSGKDLKGSPLIQRKFDEDSTDGNEDTPPNYPKYKPKSASKLVNNNVGPDPVHYKVTEEAVVDSVINVAYIEVDDSQNSDVFSTEPSSLEFTLTPPPSADDTKSVENLPEMEASDSDTDIRKWVRNEAKYVTQKAAEKITKNEEFEKKIETNNEEINHLLTAVPRRLSSNKSIDNENVENNDLLNLLNKTEFRRSNSRDLLTNRPSSLALNKINGSEQNKDDVKKSITVNKYEQNIKSIKNDTFSKDKRSTSVNDIRKTFEKTPPPTNLTINIRNSANKSINGSLNNVSNVSHGRMSSLDSTTSEGSSGVSSMMTTSQNNNSGSNNNLQSGDFGSISSLASTTSMISQQELQQLIDEANQATEDSSPSCPVSLNDAVVIVLHRETPGSSIGITLAGGVDYETKEITVHKVLVGSPAERDGRMQKGDRILSINGKSMKGVTHKESLAILKTPRPEVVLVTSRSRAQSQPATPTTKTPRKSHHQLSQSLDNTLETTGSSPTNVITSSVPAISNTNISVTLMKDGAGLGFSLEGGQDSPLGDKPLTIKKIFTGGAAEKCGLLHAGDELLKVNDMLVSSLSRVEVWSIMKKLADGPVEITVRR